MAAVIGRGWPDLARGLSRAGPLKAKHELIKVARLFCLSSCTKLLLVQFAIFVDVESLGEEIVKVRNKPIAINVVGMMGQIS